MTTRWICDDCNWEGVNPSFSEGPKVVDQGSGEVKRFTQARHVCPSCLSYNVKPLPETVQPSLQ